MENRPVNGGEVAPIGTQEGADRYRTLLSASAARIGRLGLCLLATTGAVEAVAAAPAYGADISHTASAQPPDIQPLPKAGTPDYAEPVESPFSAHFSHTGNKLGVQFNSAPYGFYLGRYPVASAAEVVATTKAGDYDAVAVHMNVPLRRGDRSLLICSWVLAGSVTRDKNQPATELLDKQDLTRCKMELHREAFPFTFGYKYNCPKDGPKHGCDDGDPKEPTDQCNGQLDGNDAKLDTELAGVQLPDSAFTPDPLFTPIGNVSSTQLLRYRFTPRNDHNIVVRVGPEWGITSGKCVSGSLQGGPANTQNPFLHQKTASFVGQLAAV